MDDPNTSSVFHLSTLCSISTVLILYNRSPPLPLLLPSHYQTHSAHSRRLGMWLHSRICLCRKKKGLVTRGIEGIKSRVCAVIRAISKSGDKRNNQAVFGPRPPPKNPRFPNTHRKESYRLSIQQKRNAQRRTVVLVGGTA